MPFQIKEDRVIEREKREENTLKTFKGRNGNRHTFLMWINKNLNILTWPGNRACTILNHKY